MSRTHDHLVRVPVDLGPGGYGAATIWDAGCGDGRLLTKLRSTFGCDAVGFDSSRYGEFGNLENNDGHDDIDIRQTNPDGSWPFDDSSVDIVVSNQVLEHVTNLDEFCAEASRVSRLGAIGVHTFPTRAVFVEPHLKLPLVHRVRDHAARFVAGAA